MRSLLLLVVLAVGAGAAVLRHLPEEASAEATVAARPQEIRSVSLDGRDLPKAALREALRTRAGELIDLATVARDRKAIEDVLIARGHLAAKVAEPRVTFGAGGAAYVTFPIEQGPLFRIRNVRVAGASAQAAGVVTLSAGEIADASRIALARAALEERLRVRRAPASVVVDLAPDLAAGTVDIELRAAR